MVWKDGPELISPYWRGKAFKAFGAALDDGVPINAAKIARDLQLSEASAPEKERDGAPSDRWIRLLRAEWDSMPAAKKAEYRSVRWPETFDAGLIPWEAAPSLLAEITEAQRLPVIWAQWWWRLRLSAPDAPADAIREVATELAVESIASAGMVPVAVTSQVQDWLVRRDWKLPAITVPGPEGISSAQQPDLEELAASLYDDPTDTEWTNEPAREDVLGGES